MSEVITEDLGIAPPLYFDSEEAFEAWCNEDTRAEYLDGEVLMHSPASPGTHESVTPLLSGVMQSYDGKFFPVPEQNGKLYSHCLPGFWIKPKWFWQTPMPSVLSLERELGLV